MKDKVLECICHDKYCHNKISLYPRNGNRITLLMESDIKQVSMNIQKNMARDLGEWLIKYANEKGD